MRTLLLLVLGVLIAACVPADEALGLGSVEFTFAASRRTREGVTAQETEDDFEIKFGRILLGFKTMTIGKVGVSDTCAYRGRGAVTNLAFDPRNEIVQTFNGIKPIDCPDVGVIFGAPDGATAPGPNVPGTELLELAGGGLQAILEATATRRSQFGDGRVLTEQKINLVFNPLTTSSRFGGCRERRRGVQILANQRELVTLRFAAEAFFRDAIAVDAGLRVRPFVDADVRVGNADGVTTMDELDAYDLVRVTYSQFYQLPNGTRVGSFGDYVRALFRFAVFFRSEQGLCVGNEPGANEEDQTDAGP